MNQGSVVHIGPGDKSGEQRYLVVNFTTNTVYVLEVQTNGSLLEKDKHKLEPK